MTGAQRPSHLYERPIAPDGDDAPALIARAINQGALVLDIGCGTGAMGRYLTNEKDCTVDGVTHNPDEAGIATDHYRRIEIANLESNLPSTFFGQYRYDFIICADVLEHLRNSDQILADLATLLAPDGQILVSVPNVCYVGVLAGLLQGRFARTREGVLDSTHVRFFDLAAVEELASNNGLSMVTLERVIRQPADTEFRFLDFEVLPAAQRALLLQSPEALVYEYVARMRAVGEASAGDPRPAELPGYSPVKILPSYETQVFFDYGNGVSEADSERRISPNDGPVEFSLRGRVADQLAAVRFDFVDRPGLFEVHEISLSIPSRGVCWNWRGDWSSSFGLAGLEILSEHGHFGGRLMRATCGEPIMLVEFDPPLQLAGEAPVVTIRQTGPQAFSRAAFQWAEEKFGQAIRQTTEIQSQLASALATVEQSLRQADVDKRHLGDYIVRLETDLAEIRAAYHGLVTSPFRRVWARYKWLLGRLTRSG